MDKKEPLLPDDVIYSILLHLPLKSLRFRHLSNRWNQNQIITSRAFSSDLPPTNSVSIIVRSLTPIINLNLDHRRHLVRVHPLIHTPITRFHHQPCPPPIQLPYLTYEPLQKILISSSGVDGLLYILCKRANGITDIVLWNPLTNRFKTVSWPSGLGSIKFVGFGYVASISDYKVVVVYASKNVVCGVSVTLLNSGGGVWTRPTTDVPKLNVMPYLSLPSFDPSRVIDGCEFAAAGEDIHWLCMKEGSVGLLSFNIREEKLSFTLLREVRRPNPLTKDDLKLCVYKGCLYLCCVISLELWLDDSWIYK